MARKTSDTITDDIYPRLAMMIDGEWVRGGGRDIRPVLNPATAETLAELPLARTEDLDRALHAAQRSFDLWRLSSPDQRSKVLRGAAQLLRERASPISRIATLEEGKTLTETQIELNAAADLFDFYGEEARRTYGRVLVRPTGTRSLVVKQPVGPVAAFAPWNFPLHNPARKLGAPIAAGCSVIMKPAEETPGSAIEIVRALYDAGLPSGVAQLVFGVPDQISRHLLASTTIRKLSFTGSTTVGKHLLKLAADTVKRTTMELGGHAPVVIFDDADVENAVNLLAVAKSRNAGQVCVSPTRFYIQESIYERFANAFSERIRRIKVGDGLDPGSEMGPMANPRRPMAIAEFTQDALKRGGRLWCGGEPIDRHGYFWQPTVLSDVSNDARIMNEEPFGPVAVMSSFKTFDDAVEQANRLPFGLAAYAFTRSAKTAMLIGDALESGMVGINAVRMASADAPFGGIKESGHGAEDGPEGLDACLVTKAIHQN